MRSRVRRGLKAGALFLSGAFVFDAIGTGCATFSAEQALVATDFCFIFDCQAGALGGVIQPCGANNLFLPGDPRTQHNPLFADCPAPQP